jgi:hypothetical protein
MGWMVNSTSQLLYSRDRPGTHWIGGWLGPRAGLEGRGKSCPLPVFDPRTVQPVTSHYDDYAISAHIFYQKNGGILSILERFDENDIHEAAPD